MVAEVPTATLPKLRLVGSVARVAGASADPLIATPKLPTLVSTVARESKSCSKSPDEPGGSNCTVKVKRVP